MKPTHHSFPDVSQENAERYRRQQAWERRKHWGSNSTIATAKAIGFPLISLVLVMTGITLILMNADGIDAFGEALCKWVLNLPTFAWLLFTLVSISFIIGYVIVRSARKSRV